MKTKPVFLLTFALLFFGSLNAQPVDWDAVIDRYVEKYQPEEMPAWLFPIIFRNGLGERDTIYIGHDDEAEGYLSPHDVVYGEAYYLVDSLSFQASWGECPGCDSLSVMDVNIVHSTSLGYFIEFRNGILPIRAYFNTALFRSDSLPQINLAPTPQLQAEVWEGSSHRYFGIWNDDLGEWEHACPLYIPIILTDSTLFDNPCAFTDSFDLHKSPLFEVTHAYGVDFVISPWKGFWTSTEEVNDKKFKAYPNPADASIILQFEQREPGQWQIIDLLGKTLGFGHFETEEKISIDTKQLNEGIYFLFIKQGNRVLTKKILIHHH